MLVWIPARAARAGVARRLLGSVACDTIQPTRYRPGPMLASTAPTPRIGARRARFTLLALCSWGLLKPRRRTGNLLLTFPLYRCTDLEAGRRQAWDSSFESYRESSGIGLASSYGPCSRLTAAERLVHFVPGGRALPGLPRTTQTEEEF